MKINERKGQKKLEHFLGPFRLIHEHGHIFTCEQKRTEFSKYIHTRSQNRLKFTYVYAMQGLYDVQPFVMVEYRHMQRNLTNHTVKVTHFPIKT